MRPPGARLGILLLLIVLKSSIDNIVSFNLRNNLDIDCTSFFVTASFSQMVFYVPSISFHVLRRTSFVSFSNMLYYERAIIGYLLTDDVSNILIRALFPL
jgi:hypothetical protein